MKSDPAWFYSSLSQVTAAVVGFMGGFVFLRLQDVMAMWRDLAFRQTARELDWLAAKRSIRKRKESSTAVPAELETAERRAWVELWVTLKEREGIEMPRSLGLLGLLLTLLLGLGAVAPLLLLGAPGNGQQAALIVPWSLLVVVFVWVNYWRTRIIFKWLKSLTVTPSAQKEYEREEEGGQGTTLGFREESV